MSFKILPIARRTAHRRFGALDDLDFRAGLRCRCHGRIHSGITAVAEFEEIHHLLKAAGLFHHGLRRRGVLLHQRRVLLGYLVHLGDGGVDLINTGGLFLAGCGDLGYDSGHLLHRADNAF